MVFPLGPGGAAKVVGLLRFICLLGVIAGATTDADASGNVSARADKVVVLKEARRLLLYRGNEVLASFRVALGRNPMGRKIRQGDGRTPEGHYVLDWRNPKSRYYRSIHISYPSAADRSHARKHGVSPGGDIMIHGLGRERDGIGADHVKWDWTDGCIAVTNAEIDRIWRLVANGTPIEIRR